MELKHIVNFTGSTVTIISPSHNIQGQYAPFYPTTLVKTSIVKLNEDLNGIPFYEVSANLISLPEPKEGVFYIIDPLIAYIVKESGRTTSDLITPIDEVVDQNGGHIGHRGFSLALPNTDAVGLVLAPDPLET